MGEILSIIEELKSDINKATNDLSDEDYIEVLEEIEYYCQTAVTAKQEELSKTNEQ